MARGRVGDRHNILERTTISQFRYPKESNYGNLGYDEYEIQTTIYPSMLAGMQTYTQKYNYEHVAQ